MKILTKTRLGLQILLQVGRATRRGELVPGRVIAKKQALNEPYLEQIVMQMRRAGLLESTRGRRGGYRLGREPERISLLDVIESFEGPLALDPNRPSTGADPSPEAETGDHAWASLADDIARHAQHVTLDQLLEQNGRCRDYQI